MIVTRCDLTPGQRAVQSAHAGIAFTFEHPDVSKRWHYKSNNLVLLELVNEKELIELIEKCENQSIRYTVFREPDINNEITAVALEPSDKTRKLTNKFKLLLNNES